MNDIYKAFLQNIPWPTWIASIDSTILFINKCYEETYLAKGEELVGKKYEEALPQDLAERYYRDLECCLKSTGTYKSAEYVGGRFLECTFFQIRDEGDEVVAVAGIIMDITAKKQQQLELEHQKGILRTIIDALPEAIFYKDKNSRFVGYNKSFENYYRKQKVAEILGRTDLEIYEDAKVAKQFMAIDQEVMASKKPKYFEQAITKRDGEVKIEENIKIPILGKDDEVWGIVGLSRDITEKKMLEAKLRYISEIDTMTGLYNRYSFEEKIKQYNEESYLPLGIIMGDVNGLKLVNDTLGHLEGDELLKNIAQVLKHACGKRGNAFRWGGDEFVILVPRCNEMMCDEIIEKILEGCKKGEKQLIQLSIALGQSVQYTLDEDIYMHIRKVEETVYRQKLLEKKSMKSSILETLKKGLEEKNMETNEHANRVVEYAVAIGKKLELRMSELNELILAAQLHDIGKISVPQELLLKSEPLTREELEILKTHAEKGYRIINACGELNNVAKYVLTHHEKWDGSGYPLGLKNEEIPLVARIISIADAYDVMTHDRVYKKSMHKEEAIEELKRCAGKQFDPYIVEQFIAYLSKESD